MAKPKFNNGAQRVMKARKTIRSLVARGTRINLDKASNFTVNEIAKAGPHPQSSAAHGQQRKRGQTGFYSGTPYGAKGSAFRTIFDKTETPWRRGKKKGK